MKCSTKTNVLRVLNLLVILGLCWWIKTKNDKTKEMIQWNTKIIHSIGVVSFTQAQNADVLLDIIAEMDKENYGTPGGVFASFEEEEFFAFARERPNIKNSKDGRIIEWPNNDLYYIQDAINNTPATGIR